MITKGYVIGKSQQNSNKYLVRIPIFESSGIGLTNNNLNTSISECTLSHNPGTYEALKPGDCVFVSFEDNLYGKPIILGKLFVEVENQSTGYQYNTDLKVTHKATLPVDTTIGNVPFDNILNYFESINTAIDRLSTQTTSSANITLFSTTTASDVSGYFKLVSSVDSPDYNQTAVDVATGVINTDNQLVGQLISEPNLIVGNPGTINIITVGNIKRTAGNNNQYAAFYFKIFKRSSLGVETEISVSNETPDIIIGNIYEEFSASALLNNVTFANTDRIVIKYFANLTGNTGSNYHFQFGGTNPVRTLFPVPISSIPTPSASSIQTNTTNFNGILSTADNTVQKALDKIDNASFAPTVHTHSISDVTSLQTNLDGKLPLTGGTITGNLTVTEEVKASNIHDWQWKWKRYATLVTPAGGSAAQWTDYFRTFFYKPTAATMTTYPLQAEGYLDTRTQVNAEGGFGGSTYGNMFGNLEQYHAHIYTNIYVEYPFSVSISNFNGDDPHAIFIDEVFVHGNVSCCVDTSYSYTFTPGWHRIDLIYAEGGGGDWIRMGWNPKDFTTSIKEMNPHTGFERSVNGTLTVNNNVVWHAGNDGSGSSLDADTLDGLQASGLSKLGSSSDFADGTLVVTSLDAAASEGPSWTIEVTGKGYGLTPFNFIAEGYNYANTFINLAGYNYGSQNITYLKVLNHNGNLAFWWPRFGYWNSFDVKVTETSASGIRPNRVSSIINSTEPSSAKKLQIDLIQTRNYATQTTRGMVRAYTSGSTLYIFLSD